MTNNWQFIGKVIHVSSKPAGKATVTTLALKRWDDTAKEKEHESTAVVETWHATIPDIGDIIVAYGELTGREWQGKWFGVPRVTKWHHIAKAEQPATPPQSEHHEVNANAYQPQDAEMQSDIPF